MTPSTDPYRPALHYMPPAGWMNDPNGLIWHQNEWHLFFQHTPPGQKNARSWGHAVSRDLARWDTLPVALLPDEHGDIWSGSALLLADKQLAAVFTHHRPGDQSQSVATSADKGRTWTKYANNPVLSDPSAPDFRDPKVFWHAPTGRYVMAIAAGNEIRFFVGETLTRRWRLASRFRSDAVPAHLTWECPDLFEIGVEDTPGQRRWALHVSLLDPAIFRSGSSGGWGACEMRYFVGDFDGETFRADDKAGRSSSHGLDDYAAVTFANAPDHRTIALGWMSHWAYASRTPTATAKGCMTLPREWTLRNDRLVQRPVPELGACRTQTLWEGADLTIRPGENPLAGRKAGDVLEIAATFTMPDIGGANDMEFGFRLRAGQNDRAVVVGVNVRRNALFVDRRNAGIVGFHERFAAHHECPLPDPIAPGERLDLHIFLDRCSAEVFAANGERYLPVLVFPLPQDNDLDFFLAGRHTLHVASLRVYALSATDLSRKDV